MLIETHLDPKPKKIGPWKLAYLINYSLKWLILLSRELFCYPRKLFDPSF